MPQAAARRTLIVVIACALLSGVSVAVAEEIRTGRGDDRVSVTVAEDGQVHVTVNGADLWIGPKSDFEGVRTGPGDDVLSYCDGDVAGLQGATFVLGGGSDRFRIGERAAAGSILGSDACKNTDIRVHLGSGADRYRSFRTDGATVAVNGGGGRDVIDATGGAVENVRCGAGRDRVTSDPADTVAKDCEQVRRAGD